VDSSNRNVPDAVDVLQQAALALTKLPAGQHPGVAEVMSAVDQLVVTARERAARDALLAVRRALRQGVTVSEVVTALDYLTSGTVTATLEALDGLTNQAGGR
jgi:hypothetical protein